MIEHRPVNVDSQPRHHIRWKEFGGRGPEDVRNYKRWLETVIRAKFITRECHGDLTSPLYMQTVHVLQETRKEVEAHQFTWATLNLIADVRVAQIDRDIAMQAQIDAARREDGS